LLPVRRQRIRLTLPEKIAERVPDRFLDLRPFSNPAYPGCVATATNSDDGLTRKWEKGKACSPMLWTRSASTSPDAISRCYETTQENQPMSLLDRGTEVVTCSQRKASPTRTATPGPDPQRSVSQAGPCSAHRHTHRGPERRFRDPKQVPATAGRLPRRTSALRARSNGDRLRD
jgi:hypothetical protein